MGLHLQRPSDGRSELLEPCLSSLVRLVRRLVRRDLALEALEVLELVEHGLCVRQTHLSVGLDL